MDLLLEMLIIGIAGKMGVGKDYIADLAKKIILQLNPHAIIRIIAFGDQLKVTCSVTHDLAIRTMFGDKPKEIRELLQQTATEQGRNIAGQDIWIKYLRAWLDIYSIREQINVVIIPDVRFQNEYQWINQQANGLVLYIKAPNRNLKRLQHESKGDLYLQTKIANHRSEVELDNYEHKYCINNDERPTEELYAELYQLLVPCLV